VYRSSLFSADGQKVYALSNREGEFVQVWRYDRKSQNWSRLTNERWDVEEFALSSDGSRVTYSINANGFSKLSTLDLNSGKTEPLAGILSGVLSGLRYQTSTKLAFSLTTSTRPMDVYSYDLPSGTLEPWTASEVGGIPPGKFSRARPVRFKSFDGRKIPAFFYRPKGPGPFPSLIWVHGGPEGQTRPSFEPIIQYLVAELGIAVIAPNIRGSDGYGRKYLALDNGFKRFDSIRDIGALLDWIETRPDLDAGRVGIHGASYGGYAVLASLVEYGDRFRAGSDVVGISNLVSFLENTRSYRQDIRRKEYGDEREPKMREYLESISPVNHADHIRSALLVVHGANDPRVPVSEAEAIVEQVRAQGVPVWYMLARSEGHSLRKRINRDKFYQLLATFFAQYRVSRDADEVPSLGAAGAPALPEQTAPRESDKGDDRLGG
jgi:dipeptidyl aminopeptidase/acylaminoacyl peptidase